MDIMRLITYYAPAPAGRGNKRCFCPSVRPSVCPSVAYMANNSRTQRPSKPKFGRRVPHLTCDLHTGFKVKRSKVGPSGSVSPLMLTHIVCHIFRTARRANFKLGIRMEDDDPHQHKRHDLQYQRSRSQGHVISQPNAVPVSLEVGGGIPCRRNPAAAMFVDLCCLLCSANVPFCFPAQKFAIIDLSSAKI